MPIYEYNCEHCKYTFDQLVMRQEGEVKCPLCLGEVKKLMSTFAVGAQNNVSSKMPSGTARPMCTTC